MRDKFQQFWKDCKENSSSEKSITKIHSYLTSWTLLRGLLALANNAIEYEHKETKPRAKCCKAKDSSISNYKTKHRYSVRLFDDTLNKIIVRSFQTKSKFILTSKLHFACFTNSLGLVRDRPLASSRDIRLQHELKTGQPAGADMLK